MTTESKPRKPPRKRAESKRAPRKPPVGSAVVKPAALSIFVAGKGGGIMQLPPGAATVDLHNGQVILVDALARAWAIEGWERLEREEIAAGTGRKVLSLMAAIEVPAFGGPRRESVFAVVITVRPETLAEAGQRRLSEAPKITFPWRCDLPADVS